MTSSLKWRLFDADGNYVASVKTLAKAAQILFYLPHEFAECRYLHQKCHTLFSWNAAHDNGEADLVWRWADIEKIMMLKLADHRRRERNVGSA